MPPKPKGPLKDKPPTLTQRMEQMETDKEQREKLDQESRERMEKMEKLIQVLVDNKKNDQFLQDEEEKEKAEEEAVKEADKGDKVVVDDHGEPPAKKKATGEQEPEVESFDGDSVALAINRMMGVEGQRQGEIPNGYFMLGTTVDVKIKKKIWNKEYVDLGSLVPRNETSQTRVNFAFAPGHTSQMSLTPQKPPPPANMMEWVNWFSIFASIYLEKYPGEGPSLFTYIHRVMGVNRSHQNTYIWRIYDEKFRRLKQHSETLPWHLLDHHVLNEAVECSAQFKANLNKSQRGRGGQGNQNAGKKGPCFAYNKVTGCKRGVENCRFQHECSRCQSAHPAFKCSKNQPGARK